MESSCLVWYFHPLFRSVLNFAEISGKAAKNHFEMFDFIAQRVYQILDLKKLHVKINSTNIINVGKYNAKDQKMIEFQTTNGVLENNVSLNLCAILEKVSSLVAKTNDAKSAKVTSLKADTVAEIMEATLAKMSINYNVNRLARYLF
jgi:hypothetical protein